MNAATRAVMDKEITEIKAGFASVGKKFDSDTGQIKDKPPAAVIVPGSPLTSRAVCLNLEIKRMGNARKVKSSAVEVDADPDMIRVSKRLITSTEFDAIKSLDSDIRSYISVRCLPSPIRGGIYLLPISLVETMEDKLCEFKARRADLVDRFVQVYPELIEQAARDLRVLFRRSDYLTADSVFASFGIAWQYVTFGTPAALSEIRPELFRAERDKAAAQWAEATEEVRSLLRVNMADLVDHMLERLSGTEGEKPKVFRDSLVANVKEFLGLFSDRNLTDDTDLEAVVKRAQDLLAGVSPEVLRKDADVRSATVQGFQAVKQALDGMLQDRPSRKITFEEDETS